MKPTIALPQALALTILGTALAAQDAVLVIRDVNVIPMDSARVIPRQTIVISGGTIVRMGPTPETPVPAGSVVIEGAQRFLMPGLMDLHVHVEHEYELPLYVANGVTTVLNTKGRPWHLALKRLEPRLDRLTPRVFSCGPYIRDLATPAEAMAAVREHLQSGFDCLKIKGDWSGDAYRALIDEAAANGVFVYGHAPRNQPFGLVLAGGYQAIAHLEELVYTTALDSLIDEARGHDGPLETVVLPPWARHAADSLAAAVAETGIWITPTQIVIDIYRQRATGASPEVLDEEYVKYIDPESRLRWAAAIPPRGAQRFAVQAQLQQYMLGALRSAGANLALGTDSEVASSNLMTVPGWAAHQELRLMVRAGLSPFEALATATRDAARFLGRGDTDGVVQRGRTADLILLRENPLDRIENAQKIDGVVVNGLWFSRALLDQALTTIADEHQRTSANTRPPESHQ